jgi:hypothetical protein
LNIGKGFQWVNGSFFEDAERLRNRPPNDIDVVTFYYWPEGINSEQDLMNQYSDFFVCDMKLTYRTDAYLVCLNHLHEEKYIQPYFKQITYWYSMWSHQRETLRWKGFYQIALDFENDEKVGLLLNQLDGGYQS